VKLIAVLNLPLLYSVYSYEAIFLYPPAMVLAI